MDGPGFAHRFGLACAQTRQLADSLERGSADRPLCDYLSELGDERHAPLNLIVLALTPEAARRALAWLSNADCLGVGIDDLQRAALAIFHVDVSPPSVPDAAAGDVLVKSVSSAEPAALRVASLRFPLNPAKVLEDPRLSRLAVSDGDLVMVAGTAGFVMTPALSQDIREFAAAVGCAAPLVLPDDPEADPPDPERHPWWQADGLFGSAGVFQPIFLDQAGEPAPELLVGPAASARHQLMWRRKVRAFRSAAELLQAQYGIRLRRLRARLKHENRGLRQLDVQARDPEKRNRLDNVRADLSDGFARIVDDLEERVKKSLLPGSALMQQVEQAVDGLTDQDLEFEKTAVNIQINVNERFTAAVTEVILNRFKQNVTDDARFLKKAQQQLQQHTEQQLAAIAGGPAPLTLRSLDLGPVWTHLRQMVKIETRSRGELPKRGLYKRILEARSFAVVLLMMFTMFAGVLGTGARHLPIFGVALILVFLGAFVWTYRSWKKEDKVRIEREIERIKEPMLMDVRRLLQDLQREKVSRFASHLDELKREVARRLDTLNKDIAQDQSQHLERERREATGRMRALEATIREFEGLRGSFGNLDKLGMDLEQALTAPPKQAVQAA